MEEYLRTSLSAATPAPSSLTGDRTNREERARFLRSGKINMMPFPSFAGNCLKKQRHSPMAADW